MSRKLDIYGYITVYPERPTNYLDFGYWSDDVEYFTTIAGIPFVRRETAGTDLGYSVYALLKSSSLGDDPLTSPDIWKLVDSNEFIYMLNAHIEQLQFEVAAGGGFFIKDGQFRSKKGMVGSQEVDYAEQPGFEPHIIIDGNTGELYVSRNAVIKGHIEAGSGRIAKFNISGGNLESSYEVMNDLIGGYPIPYLSGSVLLSPDKIEIKDFSLGPFANRTVRIKSSGIYIEEEYVNPAPGIPSVHNVLEVKADGIYRNGSRIL